MAKKIKLEIISGTAHKQKLCLWINRKLADNPNNKTELRENMITNINCFRDISK